MTGVKRDSRFDAIPDVRDGLTRLERIVLYVLHETQRERGGRNVPSAMLYGRVLEYIDLSEEQLQSALARLAASEKGTDLFSASGK